MGSPTISDDEYTYTATINSTIYEGNGTVDVTGYTLDSKMITSSGTFIIDQSDPVISNLIPADGAIVNTSTQPSAQPSRMRARRSIKII